MSKLVFYTITGLVLSFISWSTTSHSAVTGDYVLSFILPGMMFYVVGKFFVDRWRPADSPQDIHETKLWKLPLKTTPGGLWLRVGLNTIFNIGIYSVIASILVFTTTAHPVFMVLLGSLFLLRIPHLYWSIRGRYDWATSPNSTSASCSVLKYSGGSQVDRKTRWLIPIGMAIVGTALAGAGLLVS